MKNLSKITFCFYVFIYYLTCSVATAQMSSYSDVSDKIKSDYLDQNSKDLVSGKAFNIFFQKKLSNYLAGSSDLSLYQSFATYNSEKDQMNFGLNFPRLSKETGRLNWLLSPSIELGIKDNFATIRDKGKWKNDIRIGFKLTKIIQGEYINYYENSGERITTDTQKGRMLLKRAKIFVNVKRKIDTDSAIQILNKNIGVSQLPNAAGSKFLSISSQTVEVTQDSVLKVDYNDKLKEYSKEFATAEADYLSTPHAYSYSFSRWISAWFFLPLTNQEILTSPGVSVPFTSKTTFAWELNAQYSVLWEGKYGTLLANFGLKYYNNNSALSKLMTLVDYDKYIQFPGVNPLNFAKTESTKAYIGEFKEFNTTNLNLQIVYMLPFKGLVNFGVSGKFEKNTGDYSANNVKIGIPFVVRGKEKPVNIELLLTMNNINNYAKSDDFKQNHNIGLNVGLPITSLFK